MLVHPNLLRKILQERWKVLLAAALFLLFFGFINSWFVAVLNNDNTLANILRQIPRGFQSAIGVDDLRRITSQHFLVLGYTHPIPLATILAFSISISAKGLAGEIESGTIELIMTRVITRMQFVGSYIVASLVVNIILVGSLYVGSDLGAEVFGVLYPPMIFGRVILNYFLLHVALTGLAMVFSAMSSERAKVAGFSVAFVVVQFFVEFMSQSVEAIRFFQYFTVFACFEPLKILLSRHLNPVHITVLILIGIFSYLLAIYHFTRRDLIK